MSDWARIHRKFHSHRKVDAAGLAAIGLWTVCNSWCRDNRTAGKIPTDIAYGFDPSGNLIGALVREKLWNQDGDHYEFNEWDYWNADQRPKTTAAKLVHEILPPGHPANVQLKLGTEVANLLAEGIEYGVVKAALKLWLGKSNAPPSWLPMLVSDVTRKGGAGELDSALRDAWTTGDTKPLQKFGLVFTPPDLPLDVTTPADARAYMVRAKREWISTIRKEM